MPRRDYYNLLGVPRDASAEDLKRAWRNLARQWHPDKKPDDPEADQRFKELNEAWRTLSDPERRGRYDRLGVLYTEDGRPPRPEDITGAWRETFSGLFGRRVPRPGADLRITLDVSLEEVLVGGDRAVSVPRKVRCAVCVGAGAQPDGRATCAACTGTGKASGPLLLKTTCWHCAGRGYRVVTPCDICAGDGVVSVVDELRVMVPPGVGTGTKLKITGKGDASSFGDTGSLLVVVRVVDHPLFTRRGEDVVCDLPLTYAELLLGADVRVPTLEGAVSLVIPPATAPGTLLRLPQRGLPASARTGRGDALYRVVLEMPVGLNDTATEGIRLWARGLPRENSPLRFAFDRAVETRK